MAPNNNASPTNLPDSEDDAEDIFLVIGIDFGTTYAFLSPAKFSFWYKRSNSDNTCNRQSGVAWAVSSEPDSVGIISSWEASGRRDANLEKLPSMIGYDQNGRTTWWGFEQFNAEGEKFENFKLLLSDKARDSVASLPLQDTLARLQKLRKQPVDVVADYLKCVWTHTLKNLKLKLSFIEHLRFKVVLTVPAIWDHAAQELTREAASKAGIKKIRQAGTTTLDIISEPEAAALAFFNDSKREAHVALEVVLALRSRSLHRSLTQTRMAIALSCVMQVAALW